MNVEKTIRILVVDDHELVRRGLSALIETHPGWEVCGEAADGRSAVKLAKMLSPHVVVMDISMPLLNGFEAARQMTQKACDTQIIILSVHESEQLTQEVLAVGARGYVLKSDAGRDLLAAVEAVLRGETFYNTRLAARLYARESRKPARRSSTKPSGPLTSREREILQLLAEGKSNKEVGHSLKISVKTAETHRARIMRKLAIDSVADLVRYAIRNGIISV
jgi:DNA-binding NarL/FixJ family response regulator